VTYKSIGSYSYTPSLVWTGSEYGVSWQDTRDKYPNYEIYFARLDSSGSKIGSDVRVTYDSSGSYNPSLVWSGSEYGVSWYDERDGNSEIYLARLDSSRGKIGSDVRVTYDSSDSWNPSLVWTGGEYGISWLDGRDESPEIYFARLDSSGNKIGSDVRVTYDSSGSWNPSLVWTGNEYGVSWHDKRDGKREIYFARVLCCEIGIEADLNPVINSGFTSPFSTFGGQWQVNFSAESDCDDELDFLAVMKIPDVPPDPIINYLPSPDPDYSEINFYAIPAEIKQWASSASASSEYDYYCPEWCAIQATGEPDTFECDDFPTAWAPLSGSPNPEFLEVFFDKNVYATGIEIYETYIGGFVFQVDLIDMDDNYHTIWSGNDTTACPGVFNLDWPMTTYLVKGARIHTRVEGWEEIDAVQLIGIGSSYKKIECNGSNEAMLIELLNDAITNGGFSVDSGDELRLGARPINEPSSAGGIPIGNAHGQDMSMELRLIYSFGFSNGTLISERSQGPDADCVLHVKATDDYGNAAEEEVSLIQKVEEICKSLPDDIICKTR
jgi:hypothetical protein